MTNQTSKLERESLEEVMPLIKEEAVKGLKALARELHVGRYRSFMACTEAENRKNIRGMRWSTYHSDQGVQDETMNDPVYRKLDPDGRTSDSLPYGGYDIFVARRKATEKIEQRKMSEAEYTSLLEGTHEILGKYMREMKKRESPELIRSIF